MGSRCLKKFGDGDALATDQEFALGMMGFVVGGDAGKGLFAATAFDFNGNDNVTALK